MNKVYRLIWNDSRGAWMVTHEKANSRGKPASKPWYLLGLMASTAFSHTALAQPPASDVLPTGGQVISGQAAIHQSGNTMNIQQDSNKAILNWNSFSIGSDASVNFQQPSSSAVALNRVVGSDPSAIYGRLSANGQVFLVNPNGVMFGPSARVDVGGLVASTLGLSNEDFLAGNYRFSRDGSSAGVTNQGELLANYVALLAPEVVNEGVIAARSVTLAAGEDVTLNLTGNELIGVQVEQASIDTLVENRHLIQADEGTVVLSAQSAYELMGRVVNSGAIEAAGISNDGGTVHLFASGAIAHSGTINTDGGTTGNGGETILLAALANPNSTTDVSGGITARGGSEAGDGGFIETSGTKLKIADTARIDTSAPNGETGQWLLDPYDFTVGAGGDITGADLGTALGINNVTIQTTDIDVSCIDAVCGAGDAGGNGDIFINEEVTWASGNILTLDAYRNIEINAAMSFGDFMGPPQLEINYGTGGSGKAVIAQGVDWSGAGYVFDNTNFMFTAPEVVDTSRDFYIGTQNVDIYVQLNPGGSGVYGETNLPWDYYDVPGGNLINLNSVFGNVNWSTAVAARTVAGLGPTYALTYVDGLTSDYYTGFAAGNAADWTVTPRPIELTADDLSKTFGEVLDLATDPTYSVTSGSLVSGDAISSATYGSATGAATNPDAVVDVYANEITISDATGTGNFNIINYNIAYVSGALTVTAAAATGGETTTDIASETTPPTNSGNLLDIITKSLLTQSEHGEAYKKTQADFLLTVKGKGIEERERDDAFTFIRDAVEQANAKVSDDEITKWLGGVTQPPQATLPGSGANRQNNDVSIISSEVTSTSVITGRSSKSPVTVTPISTVARGAAGSTNGGQQGDEQSTPPQRAQSKAPEPVDIDALFENRAFPEPSAGFSTDSTTKEQWKKSALFYTQRGLSGYYAEEMTKAIDEAKEKGATQEQINAQLEKKLAEMLSSSSCASKPSCSSQEAVAQYREEFGMPPMTDEQKGKLPTLDELYDKSRAPVIVVPIIRWQLQ